MEHIYHPTNTSRMIDHTQMTDRVIADRSRVIADHSRVIADHSQVIADRS